jgi:hypothetical protein
MIEAPGSVSVLLSLTRLRHFIKATDTRRTALTDKRHARKLRCQIDLSTRDQAGSRVRQVNELLIRMERISAKSSASRDRPGMVSWT